eukprot:gene35727-44059_t
MGLFPWLNRRNIIRAAAATGAVLLGAYMVLFIRPNLPALDAVTDYQPKIPLRVYTADNALIGEFGEEHRDFVAIKDVPDLMKKAVLAIEDKRFYDHGGIDWIRAMGALKSNLRGSFRQGGSTITMQVARNVYLSSEKTYTRKIYEILLTFKLEHLLSKDQILEIYMNQIFLGNRAYGFAAASETYFGKALKDITVAEAAMLAGLPKAPSAYNPISNPRRIAAELAKVGIAGAYEGALKFVGNPDLMSRTHFARYIVETGRCADTKE